MPKTSDARPTSLEASQQKLIESLRKKIRDERVVEAMARTPREAFVASHLRDLAYEDMPLSIGFGQTISQPFIVAIMLEALELRGHETVLEIGTGSGYEAVLLSQLARKVVTVERVPELAIKAAELVEALGCKNVKVEQGGESLGCPGYGPYDAIVVSAAAPTLPDALLEQLHTGGRLAIPIGTREEQDLKQVVKREQGLRIVSLGPCRFVPLIGRGGWPE